MVKFKYILFFNQIGIDAIDQVGVKCFAWWTIQSIKSYSIFLMDLQLLGGYRLFDKKKIRKSLDDILNLLDTKNT
jgi:pyruvate,water dikinase